MAATINKQILLLETPKGKLEESHFRLNEGAIPAIEEGQILVRTKLISLDAANRAWMQGATYRSAVEAGTVMAGGSISEVVESKSKGFAKGDLVFADTGWQEYAALPEKVATKVAPMEPLSHLLSVYGIAGLTAYHGLLDVGKPKAGNTVVVSAAAGAVGSIVGQIAKLKGCHVVGIAGGADKCKLLVDELGFDEAIDYKAESVNKALRTKAPKGVDVYFDNVGGDVLEGVLFNMNDYGRIACCGAVSQYDGAAPAHGPRGIPGLIVVKRLTMQGFILYDFDDQREAALTDLQAWVKDGKIKVREDIMDGIENTPKALIGLLAGTNVGKRMIRV
ncbi:MAG: zinc-binding dehydrogenase [Rhizobiales bacterium]|nr:zinc-binding dehydrogenase [Hyphomicrobiales bacterium]